MDVKIRKINLFELILLFVGIGVGIVGFFIINNLYSQTHVLTWDLFQTVFLWLVLIIMLILAATMEDVKEELAILIRQQVEETRLMKEETRILRQISNEQLEELRMLGNAVYNDNKKFAQQKAKKK